MRTILVNISKSKQLFFPAFVQCLSTLWTSTGTKGIKYSVRRLIGSLWADIKMSINRRVLCTCLDTVEAA
jgi:hypothetical protein